MKKLLCLLMLLALLPLTTLAESPVEAVTILDVRYDLRSNTITDAAFIDLLWGMLTAPAERCDASELPDRADRYLVGFHMGGQQYTAYQVYHDTLYNQTWLLTPTGEICLAGCELPLLLHNAVCDEPTFDIPAEHRALLADHGWTLAFRRDCPADRLPDQLIAARTDESALHFTWANLFLQDAGYDLTPYLGKAVQPYMYYLAEPVNRVKWMPSDTQFLAEDSTGGVLYSMKAIVLECEGEIIGAYLIALSWNGSDLMSLTGNTAIDLLGEDGIRDYLLAHAAPESDLAALTQEEVIQRYSAVWDRRLELLDALINKLGTAHEGGLYRRYEDATCIEPDPAVSIRKMEGTNNYEVCGESGEIWYPVLVWESDETGWKIESFYNSGY